MDRNDTMNLVFETPEIMAFSYDDCLIVVNKELYSNKPEKSSFRNHYLIGKYFWKNTVLDVESGSFFDDEVAEWLEKNQ
jgi:hypothetical protein